MSLRTIATFGLGDETKIGETDETCVVLNIAKGSVTNFEAPSDESTSKLPKSALDKKGLVAETDSGQEKKKPASEVSKQNSSTRVGAIVNAANERCLGGGGVDGAINSVAGISLWKDRLALPILGEQEVRCHTGSAVITGPNRYGSLRVSYVVHAVGPAYFRFADEMSDDDSDTDTKQDDSVDFAEPDALLRSAYQESLERCRENGITDVAFSLLSAGVFRGKRSLNDVLSIGVTAIRDWVKDQEKANLEAAAIHSTDGGEQPSKHPLRSVTLCGFSELEVVALKKVCRCILVNDDAKED